MQSRRSTGTAKRSASPDRQWLCTDWPFENIDHAAVWFDAVAIGEDRLKIGRTNALKLFKLDGK